MKIVMRLLCLFILLYSNAKCEDSAKKNNTPVDLLNNLGKLAESEITPRLRFPAKNEDDPNQSILAEGYEETYQNSDAFPRQENYARPTLPASENPYNQQEFGGGGNYYQQRPTKNKYQNQFNRYPKPYDQFQRPQRPYDEFDRPQKPYDGFYRPQKPYDGFDRPQKPYDGFDRPQKPYDGFYRPQKPYDEFDRPYQRPQRPQRPYDQFQRPYDQFQRPYDPFQRPQRPYRRPYPGYDPQRPYPFREPYPGLDPQQLFPGPGNEGPLSSLAYALQSISRYDDQKCVPRLLCEVAAGGNPSTRQNSFLPSFNTMESLFTLLTAFGGDQISPFFNFGRAALLGISSQGRPSSCRYAYPECPRDPDELVDYLNNHNGGFFRFFNGQNLQDPQQQQQQQQDPQQQQQSQQQQLNIGQLTQLLGRPPNYFNYRRPINNRYHNRYGYYDPYYGRQNGNDSFASNDTQARIQNKPNIQAEQTNFPNRHPDGGWIFPGNSPEAIFYGLNTIPDDSKRLIFPEDTGRKPKVLLFPEQVQQNLYYPMPLPYYDHSKMIFPDRTGTGNLKFDSDKLTNSYNYNNYQNNNYYSRPARDQTASGNKKNLVYIVRGNGDPSKPEIVDLSQIGQLVY